MNRLKRELIRRARRRNLRKHVGARSRDKEGGISTLSLLWPEGAPKMSDSFKSIVSKKK